MGRPPLNVKETKVRLTQEQRERIEALVGPNRMAVFIREAIEAELQRRERLVSPLLVHTDYAVRHSSGTTAATDDEPSETEG